MGWPNDPPQRPCGRPTATPAPGSVVCGQGEGGDRIRDAEKSPGGSLAATPVCPDRLWDIKGANTAQAAGKMHLGAGGGRL
mmetsp:Transcript_18872/g.37557  ORF Transcript_18872/g.37557 Transcript_18872/m.37557 type:complete len:81 (+) Transcript_18872:608-850(+)